MVPPSPELLHREARWAAMQELWRAYDEWRTSALENRNRGDEDVDDSWERFVRDQRKSIPERLLTAESTRLMEIALDGCTALRVPLAAQTQRRLETQAARMRPTSRDVSRGGARETRPMSAPASSAETVA